MSAQSNLSGGASAAVTTRVLRQMKADGQPIACLTAYDASFARLIEQAGVDLVLVGDSLGMVIQGQDSTVPVSLDDMVYHSRCVAAGLSSALLMVDMPFMSYTTPNEAAATAKRLMQDGGAQMVKLEGGRLQLANVRYLSERGVPVCAHLGLTPQWVHKLGGYRVQGREAAVAQSMLEDALALVEAGAEALVLECVPQDLARRLSASVDVPVIGIGAGAGTDGQVLVLQDMLGMTAESGLRVPRFAKNFMLGSGSVAAALDAYVAAVRSRAFPTPEQAFD